MKIITVWQPWASLIAIGEKCFETRGWRTHYRGPLGIHAGRKIDREACRMPEIIAALKRHGITSEKNLPTGMILATAELVECWKVHLYEPDGGLYLHEAVGGGTKSIPPMEMAFGWYEQGRFAWELANVRQIDPIPATGRLSLWEYPLENMLQR